MPRNYQFVQVDVFARERLAGNPLAVFSDAHGLSDGEMQALAREMNLSETTFILPREPQIEAREGMKVRIFTVAEELPFAGHPTLGTALYLYALRGPVEQIVLDLKVGKVPVRFTPDSNNNKSDRVDGKIFGEMRQRDPEFGQVFSRDDVAQAVGIDVKEIGSDWPCQVVSTGLPFAIVPFRNLKTLTNFKPDIGRASAFLEGTVGRFFYFICPEAERKMRARMFFYGGEDPATGSAAGCTAAWMAKYKVAKSDEQVVIWQGVEAGRPSEIFVRATNEGDRITNVRVGGYAAEVLRGTVTL
ncbi:MAG TPA: PhzF family phenazine biosynthesis protein [Chthoniobacterales bacterium]|nr:PhzF family phenazine biosynthesis protein [Chthoniobacterales bacterium]